jgi:hypothetical protein
MDTSTIVGAGHLTTFNTTSWQDSIKSGNMNSANTTYNNLAAPLIKEIGSAISVILHIQGQVPQSITSLEVRAEDGM